MSSFIFHTLNADGSVYGTGCFSYEGPLEGVDIQYNFGISAGGTANEMLSFWYHDPVVGTLDISALINFNWTNGWQGAHYRFDFNLWNFPQNSHGLTAGQAQPNRLGPISGHRGNGDISGQKILQWPSLAPATVTTDKPKPIPPTRSTEVDFAFESGYFTVGSRGEVTIDFLFDGGYYQGELAMFSLEEMGTIELGSEAYIREAARRSLSNTSLGYVVISDQREAARFSGLLLGEGKDWNSGEYLGPKTFQMRAGDRFGFMLIPHGKVQQVFENPTATGALRPLFSMATATPDDLFAVGQIANIFGDGNIFAFEDKRVDTGSDFDYNDIVFQVRGATSNTLAMPSLVDPSKDWRSTDFGQTIYTYAISVTDPDSDVLDSQPFCCCQAFVEEQAIPNGGAIPDTSGTSIPDGGAISDGNTIPNSEGENLAVSQISSFIFHTLNPDGSVYGTGCFSYEGPPEGVDIQYNFGTSAGGTANKMLSFWYHDPVVGTLDINALINFNWTNGWQGAHYRFDFNLWNFPKNSHGLTAGQAQPNRLGPISGHRGNGDISGQKTLQWASLAPNAQPSCCCQAFVEGKVIPGDGTVPSNIPDGDSTPNTNVIPDGGDTPGGGVTIPEALVVGPGGTPSGEVIPDGGGDTPGGSVTIPEALVVGPGGTNPNSGGTIPDGGSPVPDDSANPNPEGEPSTGSQISSFIFHTLNADGSVYGTGCFSYEGPPEGVDIQYNSGTSAGGTANQMRSFWYHDPVVGTLDISALINFNWTNGWQGAHYRFDFNLWNFPQNSHGLTAGQAQPNRLGPISGHRGNGDISGQKTLQWPSLAPATVTTGSSQAPDSDSTDPTETLVIPQVDLVVVIDSSVSMKDEAAALSAAVDTAIAAARTSCPSDLRVTYLGIEGVFKETLFNRTVRDYLTGVGAAESDLRGRKRGTVAEGGAQEDGARAIEDVSLHFDWRANAARTVFFLGDEALEGGNENGKQDQADIEAATRAIEVASEAGVRVHTYLGTSGVKASVKQAIQAEYARVAEQTKGQAFTSQDSISGFAELLKTIICGSKQPVKPPAPAPVPATEPFCCCQAFVEGKTIPGGGGGTPDGSSGTPDGSSGTPGGSSGTSDGGGDTSGGVTIPEAVVVGPGGTNPNSGGTPDGSGSVPDDSANPNPEGATSGSTQISSFIFHTLNADGSIYGTGCFSYEGPPEGVDIQYNSGTSAGGTANKMLSFWYHDPVVGTLDISALINFNWTNGWQGAHYRLDFNLWNFPQNSHGLTAGPAQPNRLGPISGHRGNGDISGQKTLQWPSLAPATVTTGSSLAPDSDSTDPTETLVIPQVDLVVVIDSSVSMKDEAVALSAAVDTAIEAARTSCPSDLRVTYLGIEGVFKETLFNRTVHDYLTGVGAAESDLRGRKRGTVAEGGAQEDGARAIEDVSLHFDWRANAARTVFFLGDEALEGGNENGKQDQADIEAATRAIDVASEAGVRVHTYLGTSSVKATVKQAIQAEYARVAEQTKGQAFTSQDSISGFAELLKTVICGSKQPVKPPAPAPVPATEPFCCCQAFVEAKTH